jgi:hypothetical protein
VYSMVRLSLGLPAGMTSLLWVLLGSYLAPQYYETYNILVIWLGLAQEEDGQ